MDARVLKMDVVVAWEAGFTPQKAQPSVDSSGGWRQDFQRKSISWTFSAVARIKIGKSANFANKMFQYVFCKRLQSLVPGTLLDGYDIPQFNLKLDSGPISGRILHINGGHQHSLSLLSSKLREGIYDGILFEAYVQRLEYYPDRALFNSYFPAPAPPEKFGSDVLLINVRGKEIFGNLHADYGPVPVSYFLQLADEFKLTPVIMGQIGDDPYSDALRQAFKGCRFLGHVSPLQDFQTVRHAKNIVIGVSTFGWLSAWLSDTAENIYVPVKGLFNPVQRPDVNLLPTQDSRYHFYEFPTDRWHATTEQMDQLLKGKTTFPKRGSAKIRAMIR